MIEFGTRGITTTSDSGDFNCPTCASKQSYKHNHVRRFITLNLVPLIPLNKLGEYVECGRCRDTYNPVILVDDQKKTVARREAEYQLAIREIMLRMMLANGVVEDAEIAKVQKVYERIVGIPVSAENIQSEIAGIEKSGSTISTYLKRLQGRLNDEGRETVLIVALYVAFADGKFREEEHKLIMQIGTELGMTKAHINGVIGTVLESRSEPPGEEYAPAAEMQH